MISTPQFSDNAQVTGFTPDLLSYMGARWQVGRAFSANNLTSGLLEETILKAKLGDSLGDPLPVEELNKRYGLPGLEFSVPEYEPVAQMMADRHRSLSKAMVIARQVPEPFPGLPVPDVRSATSLLGFGTEMLAGLLSPLDLGVSLLLPVVGGELRVAGAAAKAGFWSMQSPRLAAAMSRGLIPRSAVPLVSRLPVIAPSVVNNIGQSLLLEMPMALEEYKRQGRVDISRAALSVGFSAAFAEGFRATLYGIGRLGSKFIERAQLRALDQVLTGKPVDVSEEIRVHSAEPEAIRAAAKEAVESPAVAPKIQAAVATAKQSRAYAEIEADLKKAEADAAKSSVDDPAVVAAAQNKASTMVQDMVKSVFVEMKELGYSGKVTKQQLLSVARTAAKAWPEGPVRSQVQAVLASVDSNGLNSANLSKLKSILGLDVVKSRATDKAQTDLGEVVMQASADVLGDVEARGDLLHSRFKEIFESKARELRKAALENIVEHGKVRSKKLREELLAAQAANPEPMKPLHELEDIETGNKKIESELGDLSPHEKAQLEAAMKAEIEEEADLIKSAADCVVRNG